MSHRYPVNLDIEGRPVLVVGGGSVAARKALGLLDAGAAVTVIAPDAVVAISNHAAIDWIRRRYRRGDVAGYRLTITATDDPAVNAQVAVDGERANVWVNSADDPVNCGFTLPSVARHGDVQVAVSTDGRSPALARWLRRRYERDLAEGFEELLDLLADARAELKATVGVTEVPGWQEALDDDLLELVRAGRADLARDRLRRHLRLPSPQLVAS